jgi:hypothetical protein
MEEIIKDVGHQPQPHTILGERGQYEVKLKVIQICECFMRGFISGETDYGHMGSQTDGCLPVEKLGYHQLIDLLYENKKLKWFATVDPMAVIQNGSCYMEKVLGIFPNVPMLKSRTEPKL